MIADIVCAQGIDVVWMGNPPANFDLVKEVPGGDFDAAWRTRWLVTVEGRQIAVVGREELIRLKRASGRPQNLVDAELLEGTRGVASA
ncbi:MAG: hypothetical protein ACO3JL_03400 [Myxococcota bacterium]